MSPLWILLTLLPIFGEAQRFNCKGRILGAYYADAKSGCKAFHVCVRVAGGGIRDFRFFCPPGTLFHQEAQTCTDWGDDDPLACPADLYDGQFDLYRIGSGFDTKKLSSTGNREEEPEFGLQRAETGDRRLAQNNGATNDLRAAHSSDFFSGQRDRGRDDSAPPAASQQLSRSSQPRQSFRRPTTTYAPPTTTVQYTTPPPPPPPQQSGPSQYDLSKRKLVRKRPIYVTNASPTTYSPTTARPQTYPEQTQQTFPPQNFKPQQNFQSQQNFQPNPTFSPQHLQNFQSPQTIQPKQTTIPQQNYQPQQNFQQQQQNFQQQQNIPQQNAITPQNFNRRTPTPNKQTPPPNVPPQYNDYKDEYVEVSRVTPKQNRYYSSKTTPAETTPNPYFNKKDKGLVELYNYQSQSTPGLNVHNEKTPSKVRNSFSVSENPRELEFSRNRNGNGNFNGGRGTPTTTDYNRVAVTSTPVYKNEITYEPEKNNFVPFSKQSYFNSPSTSPPTTTTFYTTVRPEPPINLNTVAYNTNIGFHTRSSFAEDAEDDGQYRPPEGEDDGQYRPELYDRELLSGAHSLNIAASGNRLPEDQKSYSKTQPPPKIVSQTAAPRPFRPAPTSTSPPTQTTRAPEPRTSQATYTARTFDYFQTYTTTSRPSELPGGQENASLRPATSVPKKVDVRPSRPQKVTPVPTAPPTGAPQPTRPPYIARPANNKEDTSYDYAYYDSDPGFAEYDHIEEFGRTKKRA